MTNTRKPTLRFRADGTFHILMVSDLHGGEFYTGPQKNALHLLLEETEPDVVLFGGDMVVSNFFEARECRPETLKAFLDYTLSELEEKKIPWAHVYGNHDTESPFARTQDEMRQAALAQQAVYESYPCCISGRGDEALHGLSNYVLPVYASGSDTVAYHLFALDSLSSAEADAAEALHQPGCTFCLEHNLIPGQNGDSLALFDQVKWYWDTSVALEQKAGRKIPALMWMHNPLMELRLIADNREACGFEGNLREGIGCSNLNSGLFTACLQRGDVRGIFFGHDHRNDFSGELFGIKMGYDGALYDMRRGRDTIDNRGGREIILYEDGSPIQTRQIRLSDRNLPVEEPVSLRNQL